MPKFACQSVTSCTAAAEQSACAQCACETWLWAVSSQALRPSPMNALAWLQGWSEDSPWAQGKQCPVQLWASLWALSENTITHLSPFIRHAIYWPKGGRVSVGLCCPGFLPAVASDREKVWKSRNRSTQIFTPCFIQPHQAWLAKMVVINCWEWVKISWNCSILT